MFDDIFGDIFGKRPEDRSASIALIKASYENRIEAIKKKARTLIDIAYNKAINDVLSQVGDSLTIDEKLRIAALKREVRQ